MDVTGLDDTELSNIIHAATTERWRRRYDCPPVQAATRAIQDNDSMSDAELVIQAFNGVRQAGWRIVKTETLPAGLVPVDGRDDVVEIVEEWTGA